jgi:hypothetical protein
MIYTKENNNTNYELFLNTINSLKNSQGFYSGLYNQLQEMDNEQKLELQE